MAGQMQKRAIIFSLFALISIALSIFLCISVVSMLIRWGSSIRTSTVTGTPLDALTRNPYYLTYAYLVDSVSVGWIAEHQSIVKNLFSL